MAKKPIVAILYDFDKTLATDDMQNFSFIPSLNITKEEFWDSTEEFTRKTGMEKVLSYMYMMIEKSKEKGILLTKEYLNNLGKDVKFYEGVTTWFKRINAYAEEQGIKIEHYILSSGTKEIIEGTPIAKEFKKIYASEFLFDKDGVAIWPKLTINYTSKTQYVFRISKGALNQLDDVGVNSRAKAKRIPYKNMIYIGDGLTDVPCMTLIKDKGGRSIAIYQKGKKEKIHTLIEEDRVNYICRGDYSVNSDIEKIIKLIVSEISISASLAKKEKDLLKR